MSAHVAARSSAVRAGRVMRAVLPGRAGRTVRASRAAAAVVALAGLLGAMTAVVADPAASADSAWISVPSNSAPALTDALEKRGYEVFQQRCVACHGPIPTEIFGTPFLPAMAGTQALQARYRGEIPAVLEERTNLTAALVQTVVRKGLNSMPPFRPTEVSNEDLAALSAYLTRKRN